MSISEKTEKNGLSDKEILKVLRDKYGENLMYTNGLFHMMDDNHCEIYINRENGSIDRRALYSTLVVNDDVVVAQVLNDPKMSYVILSKDNLKCIYGTQGNITYLNENIMYDIIPNIIHMKIPEKKDKKLVKKMKGNICRIISYKGEVLAKIENVKAVINVYKSYYIILTMNLYSDKVYYYKKHKDELVELTEGKQYHMYYNEDKPYEIEVVSMIGGKYRYNFEKKQAYNEFTEKIEKETVLWKVI